MADSLTGYIGTNTEGPRGKAKGIYSFSMNGETGVIENIHLTAERVNPSYLALSPSKKNLYAVNEVNEGSAVSAFSIGRDGSLKLLNDKSSGGAGPCHVVIHKNGAHAVVANYSGGVLAVLPIDKNGFLGDPIQTFQYEGSGPNKDRQEKAHAHSFTFSPDFKNGFACDLGSDKVVTYSFDVKSNKPLTPWEVPFMAAKPGSGPRHGIFHPSGAYAYVLNELESTVDVFVFSDGKADGKSASKDAGPGFEKLQNISALPGGNNIPSIAAAIRISADEKFLYASNRGHDSIAVFKILKTGLLEFIDAVSSGGRSPRDFTLDPSGNFLLALHQGSDNLVVFKVNHKTGLLKKEREYSALSPVSIVFR
jgi:6-phosphogluconolactonase